MWSFGAISTFSCSMRAFYEKIGMEGPILKFCKEFNAAVKIHGGAS